MSSQKIAELNDLMRKTGNGDKLIITAGIAAKGRDFVTKALTAVRAFDSFTPDNDPWKEHDFGSIKLDGHKIFWKIDCYDKEQEYHSPDPTAPAVTTHVLTIMLAAEY